MSENRGYGARLRAQREELGYSLQEAHRYTHVPTAYLAALEAEDKNSLPEIAYTLGFIQSYCQLLDLDPEPFIGYWRSMHRDQVEAEQSTIKQTLVEPSHQPFWLREALTWGAVCGVLLLDWLTYSSVIRPLAHDEKTGVDAGVVIPVSEPLDDEDF